MIKRTYSKFIFYHTQLISEPLAKQSHLRYDLYIIYTARGFHVNAQVKFQLTLKLNYMINYWKFYYDAYPNPYPSTLFSLKPRHSAFQVVITAFCAA